MVAPMKISCAEHSTHFVKYASSGWMGHFNQAAVKCTVTFLNVFFLHYCLCRKHYTFRGSSWKLIGYANKTSPELGQMTELTTFFANSRLFSAADPSLIPLIFPRWDVEELTASYRQTSYHAHFARRIAFLWAGQYRKWFCGPWNFSINTFCSDIISLTINWQERIVRGCPMQQVNKREVIMLEVINTIRHG